MSYLKNSIIKLKGFLPTKLKTNLKKFKKFNGYNDLDKKMLEFRDKGESNPLATVNLIVCLILQQNNNVTGKIISAIWDNWEEGLNNDLLKDDIWTLRRLIGKDRNKKILDK